MGKYCLPESRESLDDVCTNELSGITQIQCLCFAKDLSSDKWLIKHIRMHHGVNLRRGFYT